MEPLVIVSAVVVLYYGYRTVIELIRDIESDGSWEVVRETLWQALRSAERGVLRIPSARGRQAQYYNNFFLDSKARQLRSVFHKRHA